MKKILIIIVSVLLITGCTNNETSNNSKVNTNENIIKEQVIGNVNINNISLTYKEGTSNFKMTITNIADQNININNFKVTFKSKSGSIITVLNGFSLDNIEPNTSLEIVLDSDIDLSKAYSVEYEIN